MTEGTCVDEALGKKGAKLEAQEPWCKQERFYNLQDCHIIFETKNQCCFASEQGVLDDKQPEPTLCQIQI